MLVTAIVTTQGKMVGRPRLERGTNWLKATLTKHNKQPLSSTFFTVNRRSTPLNHWGFRVSFTEIFFASALHPQSCRYTPEVADIPTEAGIFTCL